jgi:hypothetical protein
MTAIRKIEAMIKAEMKSEVTQAQEKESKETGGQEHDGGTE